MMRLIWALILVGGVLLDQGVVIRNRLDPDNPAAVSGDPDFFDDFEYSVGRSDADKATPFQAAGWTGVKSEPTDNARGWLYTRLYSAIPDGCATSPNGSDRVLMMEMLPPDTAEGQTDAYMQLYAESPPAIPANVYFSMLICNVDSGSEQTQIGNRNKFLYVCNGAYGCHTHTWMFWDVTGAYNPNPNEDLGIPSNGENFWGFGSAAGVSTFNYDCGTCDPDSSDQAGPNLTLATYQTANTWYQLIIHFDTRGANGIMEMWLCPFSGTTRGTCVKTHDYEGGVTSGLTWTIPVNDRGIGHRELRMPTTVGHASDANQQYDYYRAMDDFAIAQSWDDLPVY